MAESAEHASSRGRSRILVVDDDSALAEMLQIVLRQEGFDSAWCGSGDKAVAAFRETQPDLVLLDLMLPGKDGVDVCREIRTFSGVPIIMLTAKSDTMDVVVGLEAGADDYVSKPFKAKELVARIRTRLRRSSSETEDGTGNLQIGDLTISIQGHHVRPNQVFSRETLLEQVWGYRHAADTRLVNVHVQRLRSKIEKDPEKPEIVVTVRGIGYRAGDLGKGA